MAFRFSTNLSASARASRSRGAFPGLVILICSISRCICFQAGTPPKKECMFLFKRKEDQHSERPATRKRMVQRLYVPEREGSKPSIGQTRECSRRRQNGCESKMAKIGSPTKRPTSKVGFCGDPEDAAPQLVRVKFMELRPSMCRWPIGDPKHIETFRFCGSACSSGDIYCKAHTAKAHAPNRPRTPRTTNFRLQHPVRVA
jgi:hypothetical protein